MLPLLSLLGVENRTASYGVTVIVELHQRDADTKPNSTDPDQFFVNVFLRTDGELEQLNVLSE